MNAKEEGEEIFEVVDGNGEAFRTTERGWNGMEPLHNTVNREQCMLC